MSRTPGLQHHASKQAGERMDGAKLAGFRFELVLSILSSDFNTSILSGLRFKLVHIGVARMQSDQFILVILIESFVCSQSHYLISTTAVSASLGKGMNYS
jgi:hypothetical protein